MYALPRMLIVVPRRTRRSPQAIVNGRKTGVASPASSRSMRRRLVQLAEPGDVVPVPVARALTNLLGGQGLRGVRALPPGGVVRSAVRLAHHLAAESDFSRAAREGEQGDRDHRH